MANKETVQQMRSAFLDALRIRPEFQMDLHRHVSVLFDQIAWLLPEPDAWTAIARDDGGDLLLLAGNAILTVGLEREAERVLNLGIKCHTTRTTEIAYQREDRETRWRFQFRDREPLDVSGLHEHHYDPTTPPPFDRSEHFARVLAGKAGWPIESHDAD